MKKLLTFGVPENVHPLPTAEAINSDVEKTIADIKSQMEALGVMCVFTEITKDHPKFQAAAYVALKDKNFCLMRLIEMETYDVGDVPTTNTIQ